MKLLLGLTIISSLSETLDEKIRWWLVRQSVPSIRLVCIRRRITLSTLVVLISSANSIPLLFEGLWKHRTSWKSCWSLQFLGLSLVSSSVTGPSQETSKGGIKSSTGVVFSRSKLALAAGRLGRVVMICSLPGWLIALRAWSSAWALSVIFVFSILTTWLYSWTRSLRRYHLENVESTFAGRRPLIVTLH